MNEILKVWWLVAAGIGILGMIAAYYIGRRRGFDEALEKTAKIVDEMMRGDLPNPWDKDVRDANKSGRPVSKDPFSQDNRF